MSRVVITITGSNGQERHSLARFSMLEPSTMYVAFVTTEGKKLYSHGCLLSFDGDVDRLPSVDDLAP